VLADGTSRGRRPAADARLGGELLAAADLVNDRSSDAHAGAGVVGSGTAVTVKELPLPMGEAVGESTSKEKR
jgi:hypothetical protein